MYFINAYIQRSILWYEIDPESCATYIMSMLNALLTSKIASCDFHCYLCLLEISQVTQGKRWKSQLAISKSLIVCKQGLNLVYLLNLFMHGSLSSWNPVPSMQFSVDRHVFGENEAVRGSVECLAAISVNGMFPPSFRKWVKF